MHQREGRGPRLLARPAGVMAASLLATLLAAAACGGERRGTPRQPHARAARGVWGRIAPAAAAAVAGLRPLTGLNHSLATGGEGRATGGLGGRGGLSTRKVGDGGPLTQCRPGAGGGGGRRGVPNQRRYVANRPSCRPPPPSQRGGPGVQRAQKARPARPSLSSHRANPPGGRGMTGHVGGHLVGRRRRSPPHTLRPPPHERGPRGRPASWGGS